jgi:hypothetical protein
MGEAEAGAVEALEMEDPNGRINSGQGSVRVSIGKSLP